MKLDSLCLGGSRECIHRLIVVWGGDNVSRKDK